MATFKTIKSNEFVKSSPQKVEKVKEPRSNKRKTMSFTLTEDVYDFLMEQYDLGMNRSKIVVMALRDYMEKNCWIHRY